MSIPAALLALTKKSGAVFVAMLNELDDKRAADLVADGLHYVLRSTTGNSNPPWLGKNLGRSKRLLKLLREAAIKVEEALDGEAALDQKAGRTPIPPVGGTKP